MNTELDHQRHLLVIDDKNFLSGESVLAFFKILLKSKPYKYVILNDVTAIGENCIYGLFRNYDDTIFRIKDLLNIMEDVKHFEWGDFYFFDKFPSEWDHTIECDYPYLIKQSETVVRLIDDQYIYLYTTEDSVIEVIKNEYSIESLKTDFLDKLDFPY